MRPFDYLYIDGEWIIGKTTDGYWFEAYYAEDPSPKGIPSKTSPNGGKIIHLTIDKNGQNIYKFNGSVTNKTEEIDDLVEQIISLTEE